MQILLLSSLLLFTLCTNSFAATWWSFSRAFNDNTTYYFDMDTVQKGNNNVTLWVKNYINFMSDQTNAGFSYATRVRYYCKNRKVQTLSYSEYDKIGNFIKSNNTLGQEDDIAPGTISESIFNTVCNNDFPLKKTNDQYYIVERNDIKADAEKFFDNVNSSKIDKSPNKDAEWYVFNKGFNDKVIFFFDAKSVKAYDNKVRLWLKYVNNLNMPDEDGSYATALDVELNCLNNNYQTFFSSIYDKNNKFIKSSNKPSIVRSYENGSIYEVIKTSVCNSDLNNIKDNDHYFKVFNNDIFNHTYRYYENVSESMIDNAPK